MKVKFFLGMTESEVNAWLDAHPEIRICFVTQTPSAAYPNSRTNVSVWYEDHPQDWVSEYMQVPRIPVPPRIPVETKQ